MVVMEFFKRVEGQRERIVSRLIGQGIYIGNSVAEASFKTSGIKV